MQFPNGFNSNGRTPPGGDTPIIGQKSVPMMNFQIQITQELMEAVQEFATGTGLDGPSLLNYVMTRGLAAIRQDLIYAQEERDALRDSQAGPSEE